MLNKYDIDLDFAISAYNGTSFSPEVRGKSFVDNYNKINAEIKGLCEQYGVEPDRLLAKHKTLSEKYLASHSRCISVMIAGAGNFPVKSQNKKIRYMENHLDSLTYFRSHVEAYLRRITRKKETEDDKKSKWLKEIEEAKNLQNMMKEVNQELRKGFLTPEEVYKAHGLEFKKNCWGNYGFESYELRNNLAKIKRLEAQVATIDKMREKKQGTGFDFDGGKVEFDAEEIRYNIFFDNKPDDELRAKLKSRGFKWSPKRGAWTRGAKTINLNTVKQILGVN